MTGSINHPRHYNMGGEVDEDGSAKYEVIKLIEDLGWGFDFCMGNALKYVLRAPHKGAEVEDLQKAAWYLKRASKRRGRVRAEESRKMSVRTACEALGLGDEEHQMLMLTVLAISRGNPMEALNNLNVYMVRFRELPSES